MFGVSKEKKAMQRKVANNVQSRRIENAMKAAEKADKAAAKAKKK